METNIPAHCNQSIQPKSMVYEPVVAITLSLKKIKILIPADSVTVSAYRACFVNQYLFKVNKYSKQNLTFLVPILGKDKAKILKK